MKRFQWHPPVRHAPQVHCGCEVTVSPSWRLEAHVRGSRAVISMECGSWRVAVGRRVGPLELPGELEQRRFVSEAADEVSAHGQSVDAG